MRISDWSSDVCSSDLDVRATIRCKGALHGRLAAARPAVAGRLEELHGVLRRNEREDAGVRNEGAVGTARPGRSEEHTSELQSLMSTSYAVSCLNQKHNNKNQTYNTRTHDKHDQ